jgi:surfactin synthase thioesterase subunit
MPTVEQWFPYRRTGDMDLFAFPHAGAASTAFSALRAALLPGGVALAAAVMPGHGRRIRETPHRRMASLMADFEASARADGYAAFHGEYVLLGHCSGSLIAYEVAKLLVRAPCRNPALLVVCSCLAPRLIFDSGMSRLPTDELLAQTASLGGTPDALLTDPDFIEVLERPLRADWEVYDSYVEQPAAPLPVPILAVRGADDPNCEARGLQLWHRYTSEKFRTAELDSGHWALDDAGAVELAREIHASLSVIPAA